MNNKNLKIVHLNASTSGGAYSAAKRLNDAFVENGYNSTLITKPPYKFIPTPLIQRIINKIFKRKNNSAIRIIDDKYHMFNMHEKSYESTEFINKIVDQKPDIIILHWITSFIAAKDIAHLKHNTNAKIFWYLLDMAPLTGGCHYAWDCKGYQNNCEKCPAMDEKSRKHIADNFKYRKNHLISTDIIIVAPTKTMLHEQVKKSTLFKDHLSVCIPIAIDQNIFKNRNKAALREVFDIDQNDKVIFFGSSYNEKRKGLNELKEALNIINANNPPIKKKITLLIAGNHIDRNDPVLNNFNCKYIGNIGTDLMLSFCYNVADLFASPSLEDTGPMMVNEAIGCETPVVSFNIGVAKDLITNGVNGYIIPNYNTQLMADGILKVLNGELAEDKKLNDELRLVLNYKNQTIEFSNLFH